MDFQLEIDVLGALKDNQSRNDYRTEYKYISSDINTLYDIPFKTHLKDRHFTGSGLLELTNYSFSQMKKLIHLPKDI